MANRNKRKKDYNIANTQKTQQIKNVQHAEVRMPAQLHPGIVAKFGPKHIDDIVKSFTKSIEYQNETDRSRIEKSYQYENSSDKRSTYSCIVLFLVTLILHVIYPDRLEGYITTLILSLLVASISISNQLFNLIHKFFNFILGIVSRKESRSN